MWELPMLPTGFQSRSEGAPERLGTPLEPPRQPQEASGSLQDTAKSLPIAPQSCSRASQEGPRGFQEPPRCSKTPLGSSKHLENDPHNPPIDLLQASKTSPTGLWSGAGGRWALAPWITNMINRIIIMNSSIFTHILINIVSVFLAWLIWLLV